MVRAQHQLEFIPPLNPLVLQVTQLLLPAMLRSQTAMTRISVCEQRQASCYRSGSKG